DPNRDDQHGRIYRVTPEGKQALKPAKLKGKPIAEVLAAFMSKENGTRYRARLELSSRKADEVVTALNAWSKTLDPANPTHAQALLEGLWVLEEHRKPDLGWIAKTYKAAEPRVRAAAIRTLGHWAGRIQDWGPVLLTAAKDDAALVRTAAARTRG
ncbi:MAG: hypothetical protein ACKOAH_09575, partial [Pirellula sp.]